MKWNIILCFALIAKTLNSQDVIDSSLVVDVANIDYKVNAYQLTGFHHKIIDSLLLRSNLLVSEFELNGYADNQGTDSYNLNLSEKRNHSIEDYLIGKGVRPNKIHISSHGEQYIADHESSEKVKQRNRRVTIKLIQAQQFKIFKGFLTGEESSTRIAGQVTVYTNHQKKEYKTDSLGNFYLEIPLGKPTEVYFSSEGYFPHIKKIKLSTSSITNNVLISLRNLELGRKLKTNLEFVRGKSILLENSANELDALYNFIVTNKDVCLEIGGHVYTSQSIVIDSNSNKFGLSVARSLELYNYLIGRGISGERLLAKGYGNSELLYPDAQTEREKSANRRVEIKIQDCDSTATIANPVLIELESFRTIEDFPLGRQYNEMRIDQDLKSENDAIVIQIKKQAAKLVEQDLLPINYTYLQLYSMYRKQKIRQSK